MLNNIPKKFFILAIFVVLVVGFLVLIFSQRQSRLPKLISTTPQQQAIDVGLNQNLSFIFNSPVNADNLKTTSIPSEDWTITNLSESVVILSHKLLFLPYTDYQVTLQMGGQVLTNLSFRTIKSQSDPRLVQTIEEQMKVDYPLARHTPLETPSYRVVYSAPLTLEITLKNSTIPKEQVITEVKAWVSQNGGDPEKHKYVVVPPSP